MIAAWVQDLLAWYDQNARELPWRKTREPYAVWIAEVMLQQTRVETVLPYYRRWMKRFPSLSHLAEATPDEVLQHWEGLGYYRRAHNLHRSARILRDRKQEALPEEAAELEKLPGIGRYTAAAIASIAYGQDAVALDGNLRRVLARLFDVQHEARSPSGERELVRLAEEALPPGQASAFNQALMDLGSTICTPRAPACERCPLSAHCRAFHLGIQELRPVRAARRSIPTRRAAAGVLVQGGQVLIGRRASQGLLAGLWGFPGGELHLGEDPRQGLSRILLGDLGTRIEVHERLPELEHAYTHYRVELQPFLCSGGGQELRSKQLDNLTWARPEELAKFPMGKLDRRVSEELNTRLPLEER